jgi:uncharacterized OB-fold protein
MSADLRPFPDPVEPEYADHFAALAEGVVQVRRCTACRTLQWPPRATCAECGHGGFEGWAVEPAGEVYTFTVVHRGFHPWFAERLPYAVAVVQLADGLRLTGLYDGPLDDLRCGLPVAGRAEAVGGAPALLWTPSGGAR